MSSKSKAKVNFLTPLNDNCILQKTEDPTRATIPALILTYKKELIDGMKMIGTLGGGESKHFIFQFRIKEVGEENKL